MRLPARSVTSTQLSKKQAAILLGYSKVSWDNASGKEAQPASSSKKWTDLTTAEKSAATALDYTEQTWTKIAVTEKRAWSDLNLPPGEDVCLIAFVLVG